MYIVCTVLYMMYTHNNVYSVHCTDFHIRLHILSQSCTTATHTRSHSWKWNLIRCMLSIYRCPVTSFSKISCIYTLSVGNFRVFGVLWLNFKFENIEKKSPTLPKLENLTTNRLKGVPTLENQRKKSLCYVIRTRYLRPISHMTDIIVHTLLPHLST